MLGDVLSLLCDTLEVACQGTPEGHDSDAPTGPLWDVKVPGSRAIVPFVLDFARCGQQVRLAANDRPFATVRVTTQPVMTDKGLQITVERSFFGGQKVATPAVVPFTHPKADQVCSGGWTVFGAAEVIFDPTALLPEVLWRDGAAVLRWETPPGIRTHSKGPLGLRQRLSETRIKEIQIGEFKGRVIVEGRLRTLLLPDAEWA